MIQAPDYHPYCSESVGLKDTLCACVKCVSECVCGCVCVHVRVCVWLHMCVLSASGQPGRRGTLAPWTGGSAGKAGWGRGDEPIPAGVDLETTHAGVGSRGRLFPEQSDL